MFEQETAEGNEPLKVLKQGVIGSNCALQIWQPNAGWIRTESVSDHRSQVKGYGKIIQGNRIRDLI